MKHKNDEWKEYVKQAKVRLNQSRLQPPNEEAFYINCKRLTKQDIFRLNGYIFEVLASDEFVSDPLGRLIEHDVFEKLSEEEKTRYILNLSSVYLSLRAKFNKK